MSRYSKTIVALLGALATWGITASEDGAYSQTELWGAVLALATAAGVYAWPNTPPAGEPRDPSMSEQADHGHADAAGLAVIAAVAILVVLAYHLLLR